MLGEKPFISFYSVYELARALGPFEIGNKNEDLVALVKNETKFTCTDMVSLSVLCVLALSSVICQSINLFYSNFEFTEYEKMFN